MTPTPSASVKLAEPAGALGPEETLYEGHPALISSLSALLVTVLTLGLGALYYWALSSGVRYKVTTRRVIVERGLLSKRLEQVDAYRIKDYVVDRPFAQRLMGTGNLLLITMDTTTPNMELRGLKTDVVALYDRLRAAAEQDRARRGVRIVDNE